MQHRYERPPSDAVGPAPAGRAAPGRVLAGGTDLYPGARRPADGRNRCSTSPRSPPCAASAATSRRAGRSARRRRGPTLVGANLPPLFDALKAGRPEVGGAHTQNAGTVAGKRLQRLARRRQHAGAAGDGRASSSSAARGRRASSWPIGPVRARLRGAPARRPTSSSSLLRHSGALARGRDRSSLKLGGRRYLTISIRDRRRSQSMSTRPARSSLPCVAVGSCSACRAAPARARGRACVGVAARAAISAPASTPPISRCLRRSTTCAAARRIGAMPAPPCPSGARRPNGHFLVARAFEDRARRPRARRAR